MLASSLMAKPDAPETPETTRSLRVPDDLWERVKDAAAEDQVSMSAFVRGLLREGLMARTGGIDAAEDREFAEALDRLRMRYMKRKAGEAIRMAVVTFRALLDETGIDPVALLDAKRAALPGGPKKKG